MAKPTVNVVFYNNIVSRVNDILGMGTGSAGLGQRTLSTRKLLVDEPIILAEDWNKLRRDLNTVYQLQNGRDENDNYLKTRLNKIFPGNVIGNLESNIGSGTTISRDERDIFTIVTPDENKGQVDYRDVTGEIEDSRFYRDSEDDKVKPTVAPTNLIIETIVDPAVDGNARFSDRFQNLTGTIRFAFSGGYVVDDIDGNEVVVPGGSHARHFFNAGGTIDIFTEMSGASSTKDLQIQQFLDEAGTISLGAFTTTHTGGWELDPDTGEPRDEVYQTTVAENIGFYNLTNQWKRIYSHVQGPTIYEIIDGYEFVIDARRYPANGQIDIRCTWRDPRTEDATPIDGDISVTAQVHRPYADPSSSTAEEDVEISPVVIPSPNYVFLTPLRKGNPPDPADEI